MGSRVRLGTLRSVDERLLPPGVNNTHIVRYVVLLTEYHILRPHLCCQGNASKRPFQVGQCAKTKTMSQRLVYSCGSSPDHSLHAKP